MAIFFVIARSVAVQAIRVNEKNTGIGKQAASAKPRFRVGRLYKCQPMQILRRRFINSFNTCYTRLIVYYK